MRAPCYVAVHVICCNASFLNGCNAALNGANAQLWPVQLLDRLLGVVQGSFASDLFSTTAWFGQIVLIILYYTLPNGFNPNTALYVMEGIRCATVAAA